VTVSNPAKIETEKYQNIRLNYYYYIKLHEIQTLTLPVLLYGSETWTIKASDARRITAAEMKYMRRTS
jgi:hypothetical protein